jgi:integration host factor subunit beta
MNNSDLVNALKNRTALSTKEAKNFCNTFFGAIKKSLAKGDRVEIRGFGSFMVKNYKAYTGRNPKSGEKIHVPPKKLPSFKVGKKLKEIVDE